MWWGARQAGKGLSFDLPCSADGRVSFELLPRQRSVCSGILGTQLPDGSAVGRGWGGFGGVGGKSKVWESREGWERS